MCFYPLQGVFILGITEICVRTGCWTNGPSVQEDIFWTLGAFKYWSCWRMGSFYTFPKPGQTHIIIYELIQCQSFRPGWRLPWQMHKNDYTNFLAKLTSSFSQSQTYTRTTVAGQKYPWTRVISLIARQVINLYKFICHMATQTGNESTILKPEWLPASHSWISPQINVFDYFKTFGSVLYGQQSSDTAVNNRRVMMADPSAAPQRLLDQSQVCADVSHITYLDICMFWPLGPRLIHPA